MKIGILTQPLHNNYGGLLQAYALQQSLKKIGHEAWLIRRENPRPPLWRRMTGAIKRFLLQFIFNDKRYTLKEERKITSKHTLSFINNHICPQTALLTTNRALKKEANKQKFEGYVVGSDQVWRPMYSPCITNYFLDFAENKTDIKRVAYAASFGVDDWEFSKKQTDECRRLTQLFDAVSVRESSGVRLSEDYLHIAAVQTLDPTLLLNDSDYSALITNTQANSTDGVLTCFLDATPDKNKIAGIISEHLKSKLYSIMPTKKVYGTQKEEHEMCVYQPVEKWIAAFKTAKYVVTDSFHACVFSIIFNKPFIAIGNKERGMARFNSLFDLFSLNSRLISHSSQLTNETIDSEIDWNKINFTKKQKQEESLLFLKRNLS